MKASLSIVLTVSLFSFIWLALWSAPPSSERLLKTSGSDPVYDVILQDIEDARSMRADGQAGHAQLLRKAAAELAAAGRPSEAIEILSEVIDHQESIHDHREALRQQGQYYRQLGNHDAALTVLDSHAAMYERDGFGQGSGIGYASGQVTRSQLLFDQGRYQECLAVAESILDLAATQGFHEHMVGGAHIRRARCHAQLDRPDLGAKEFDSLFAKYPDFGVDRGMNVSFRLEHIALRHPDITSDGYWDALVAIWDDPALIARPEILIKMVGRKLIETALHRADYLEQVLFAQEIIQTIDARREGWLADVADPMVREDLSRFLSVERKHCLINIQSGANAAGRPDLRVYALEELIRLQEDPQTRANLEWQLQRTRERMR